MIAKPASVEAVVASEQSSPTPHPVTVPPDMHARLTPEQSARLELMLASRSTAHAFDYRASTSFLGRRFYLALFAGAEARSPDRLEQEGLTRRLPSVLFDIVSVCLGMSVLICLATGAAVIGVYAVKSALGIDLLAGPSLLHDYFYWR